MSYLLRRGRGADSRRKVRAGHVREISRKPIIGLGLVVLAVLSTSCFGSRVTGKSVPNVGQIGPAPEVAGDVLAPGPPYPFYLFERATPPADIQASSLNLIK